VFAIPLDLPLCSCLQHATATTFASFQVFGTFVVFRQVLKNFLSHSVHDSSIWRKNSRCKLSTPGAFPDLSVLIAVAISSNVKSLHRLVLDLALVSRYLLGTYRVDHVKVANSHPKINSK